MHDIRALRETPELYEKAWAAKGRSGAAAQALDLDSKVRAAKLASETTQSRRNDLSKRIGQAKAQTDEARAQALIARGELLMSGPWWRVEMMVGTPASLAAAVP